MSENNTKPPLHFIQIWRFTFAARRSGDGVWARNGKILKLGIMSLRNAPPGEHGFTVIIGSICLWFSFYGGNRG